MSVIAKFYVARRDDFGTGSFVELACVADNDMMAAYAKTEEDKLFSRYSPWGEVRLNQRSGWTVFEKDDGHVAPPAQRQTYYGMLLTAEEAADHAFPGAAAFIKVNCYAKTKFAQDGSRVELREVDGWKKVVEDIVPESSGYRDWHKTRASVIEKISWKMHVDNPPAEAGFTPGQSYWLAFYDGLKFDRDAAIAAAHGRVLADG